jgi:hypothetical protein
VLGVYALALHEELGQVLGLSICDGPSVVFHFKGWLFLLFLISDGDIIYRLVVIISLNNWGWLWLRESLVLDLVFLGVFFFVVELEANHCSYFSNVLLYLKELIHISQL